MIGPTRSVPRRRWLLLLLVVALIAAACSSDGGDVQADGSTTTAASAAGGTPETAPGSSPTTGSSDGGDDPAAPPSSATDTTASTAAPTTEVAEQPVPAPGAVGAYAPFFLRPAESASIVLEMFAQSGAEPRQGTVDHVRTVLAGVSGKEVTVQGGALGGGARTWTSADIRALADANGASQSRQASVLKLYFVLGEFADSDSVLGVAVRSDIAVVFADKVERAAGLVGDPAAIEDAVAMHEMGHLLGLVDLVLATGRQDPEHPGHSPSRDSVMYYAVESDLIGTLLEGGPPRDFDDADLADLAQIRTS